MFKSPFKQNISLEFKKGIFPFNFDADPDPGSALENMDPDPFLTKIIFNFYLFLIFILKLDEPFRNEEIFIISLLFKSSDLVFFMNKKGFFAVFG